MSTSEEIEAIEAIDFDCFHCVYAVVTLGQTVCTFGIGDDENRSNCKNFTFPF